MSSIPDYAHNLSLRMSQVMDGIGVNEKIVMKRRRSMLLNESLFTVTHQLRGNDGNVFIFGSQTEGTTTPGLQSDTDMVICSKRKQVIEDMGEFDYGKVNMLMIQDENVSPGYCLLQILINDALVPYLDEINYHSYRDRMGRILVKNSTINTIGCHVGVRHGPAFSEQYEPDSDFVPAFLCQSSAVQAGHWLNQDREELWPTNDMIHYCLNTPFFVVGVGKKGSRYEKLEWRISTSFAERGLMYNLNITQIRCYILMKMILKTFITQIYPDSISSFMCKTVLLHCISYTRSDAWKENTIFTCLSFCLSTLYNCVQYEYCPHFFIPQNNLMDGRFSPETKPLILETLQYVIESNGRALLEIKYDKFDIYLQSKLDSFVPILAPDIAGQLLADTAVYISVHFTALLCEIKGLSPRLTMQKLVTLMLYHANENFTYVDRKAYCLLIRHFCSTLGSVLASSNIDQRDNLTFKKALSFMSLGLDSDLASGKLKLASVLYSAGEIERTELVLKNIERYDFSVVNRVCICNVLIAEAREEKRFNSLCLKSNEEYTLFKRLTATCVFFMRCEINCCPFDLRYEMFRSTKENYDYDFWMDMAVVDYLPCLYFLQYKTYSRLGRKDDQQRALTNFVRTIEFEPYLGHRETALNILGQCMEQENNVKGAFKCYALSLQIRGRNNSAKIHICKLLNKVINN